MRYRSRKIRQRSRRRSGRRHRGRNPVRQRAAIRSGPGFQTGWAEGWRLGACQGVIQQTPALSVARSPLRILYVPQGFHAIDDGVISALESSSAQVIVAPAAQTRQLAEQHRPDAVLVMNGLHVFPGDHPEQIRAVRAMGIPTAIWFVDDPYVTDETPGVAANYDIVFTHERSCLPLYQQVCPQVHHLPLAVNPRVFQPMRVPPEYQSDICFIGVAFWNRVRLFDELATYLQDKKVFIAGSHWDRMTRYPDLARFIRSEWIEVPETVKYYNGAKIVINLHRTTEAGSDNRNSRNIGAVSINPRTYEIAACGTLQLTDMRAELPEHYEIGSEIAAFNSAADLMAKIDFYLNNEAERVKVAARSFRRTFQNHTFDRRIGRLLEVLESNRR
ncbi:CgeB family protein [Cohnella zeiphila]|uniref:Glycosyltransferase n=1 Tax=Cohnella zeiphila TaxID=2761120 RepID=A0A7X0SM62_9BACL|nr:glycosyltransferase [Cohnella zeiphila]MBB6732572.1 glycosyltransferase [Cohnella zeiphila]